MGTASKDSLMEAGDPWGSDPESGTGNAVAGLAMGPDGTLFAADRSGSIRGFGFGGDKAPIHHGLLQTWSELHSRSNSISEMHSDQSVATKADADTVQMLEDKLSETQNELGGVKSSLESAESNLDATSKRADDINKHLKVLALYSAPSFLEMNLRQEPKSDQHAMLDTTLDNEINAAETAHADATVMAAQATAAQQATEMDHEAKAEINVEKAAETLAADQQKAAVTGETAGTIKDPCFTKIAGGLHLETLDDEPKKPENPADQAQGDSGDPAKIEALEARVDALEVAHETRLKNKKALGADVGRLEFALGRFSTGWIADTKRLAQSITPGLTELDVVVNSPLPAGSLLSTHAFAARPQVRFSMTTGAGVNELAFHNNELLVAQEDGFVSAWDVSKDSSESNNLKGYVSATGNPVKGVAFVGNKVFVAGERGVHRLAQWGDTTSACVPGESSCELGHVTSLASSPDGKNIFIGTEDGRVLSFDADSLHRNAEWRDIGTSKK